MIEIKFTLDATPALLCTLQDLAGAIRAVAHPVTPLPSGYPCGQLTSPFRTAELREGIEKDSTAENAQNLPSEAHAEEERTETPDNVEEPKKRKSRAKKAPSESNTPVAPASGDNLSADGASAEPGQATPEGTHAPAQEPAPETAPAPVADDPTPIVTQDPVEETPAPEPATEIVTPAPVAEAPAATAEDPLAGKGQTGEVLTELTRKAIGELDAAGVDRSDANRRIRDYCARTDIKFPTFPALLQAVGYSEAMAICKGARV